MNKGLIGQGIARRRAVLGVAQAEVAELAGISVHSLVNLESEKGNPTLKSLMAVCDVLGLELSLSVKGVSTEGRVEL